MLESFSSEKGARWYRRGLLEARNKDSYPGDTDPADIQIWMQVQV